MPITIDWATGVISVPQSYLTLVSGSLYEFDTEQARLDICDLEAGEEGIVFDVTHVHNTEVTISGVTFARLIEFINGYTFTFEDGQYRVRLAGSNNNITDVANLNQVSLLQQNSTGLIGNIGEQVLECESSGTSVEHILQRLLPNRRAMRLRIEERKVGGKT